MNYLTKYPISKQTMDYFDKVKSKAPNIFEGVFFQRRHNMFYFETEEMARTFERRVHHLRMRNEMREDYEKLGLEEKKKIEGAVLDTIQRCGCPFNEIVSLFDCPHIPYREVVKVHDLLCNTPPPLIRSPSQETLHQIESLPEDVQKFLLQRDLNFTTDEARTQWEDEVEVEILRREVISRYLDMSVSQNDALKPKLQSICSEMSIPNDFSVSWIITHIHFSLVQMKQIYALFFDTTTSRFVQPKDAHVGAGGVFLKPKAYSLKKVAEAVKDSIKDDDLPENVGIFFDPPPTRKTSQEEKDDSPITYDDVRIQGCFFTRKMYATLITEEEKEEDYIQRVTSILHNVAALSSQNKSLTQELIGSPLQTFAAYLVKTRVEDFGLKLFEDSIRIATDTKNPFSLIFRKFDKISASQKDIIFGLLGVDKKEGEAWICEAVNCCLKMEADSLNWRVLKKFLEKL